mmetsp:Transcript_11074/g.33658  ORF Transcript_11074/g.33658 Transcript_11074/m.33658 type:complete len:463 (-) Transcript_11074:163-1551(-)
MATDYEKWARFDPTAGEEEVDEAALAEAEAKRQADADRDAVAALEGFLRRSRDEAAQLRSQQQAEAIRAKSSHRRRRGAETPASSADDAAALPERIAGFEGAIEAAAATLAALEAGFADRDARPEVALTRLQASEEHANALQAFFAAADPKGKEKDNEKGDNGDGGDGDDGGGKADEKDQALALHRALFRYRLLLGKMYLQAEDAASAADAFREALLTPSCISARDGWSSRAEAFGAMGAQLLAEIHERHAAQLRGESVSNVDYEHGERRIGAEAPSPSPDYAAEASTPAGRERLHEALRREYACARVLFDEQLFYTAAVRFRNVLSMLDALQPGAPPGAAPDFDAVAAPLRFQCYFSIAASGAVIGNTPSLMEALACTDACIDLSGRAFPADHERMLRCRVRRAGVLQKLMRYDEADAELRRAAASIAGSDAERATRIRELNRHLHHTAFLADRLGRRLKR